MSLPAFNRILAHHLALALIAGAPCDEELVTRCYETAGRDIEPAIRENEDPLARDIRMLCIAHDLDALRHNESRLRRMSLSEAETEILQLLNPDVRVAGAPSTGPLP